MKAVYIKDWANVLCAATIEGIVDGTRSQDKLFNCELHNVWASLGLNHMLCPIDWLMGIGGVAPYAEI
jgi:hypothetical protein